MKLTTRELSFLNAPLWQATLHVGDIRTDIGSLHPTKKDCIKEAEEIVVAFAKEKIAVIHDEIY